VADPAWADEVLGALGPRPPVLVEKLMAQGDGFAAWRWD